MKKGYCFLRVTMFVSLLVLGFAINGCGGGAVGDDPSDRLPNGGAIDEAECRDACDKVGDCLAEANGLTDTVTGYVDQCKQSCDQSGYFDNEALICIQTTTECDGIFDCGFNY